MSFLMHMSKLSKRNNKPIGIRSHLWLALGIEAKGRDWRMVPLEKEVATSETDVAIGTTCCETVWPVILSQGIKYYYLK